MSSRLFSYKAVCFQAVLSLVVVTSVNAVTLTYSDSTGSIATDFATTGSTNPFASSTIDSLALGQFDSALGTLNSVSLTIAAGFESDVEVTNVTNDPSVAQVSAEIDIVFETAGLTPSISLEDDSGFQTFNGGTSLDFAFIDSSSIQSSPSDFSAFIGTENFLIDFFTITQNSIAGGGGNFDSIVATVAFVNAEVTYDYTEVVAPPMPPASEVPEPATLALLAFGLLGAVARKQFS